MPPSAVPVDSTAELTSAAVNRTITKTAPSIAPATTPLLPTPLPELDASKLVVSLTTNPQTVPEPNSPEVWAQSTCSDHMVTVRWTSTGGWDAPELKPYGPFSIMPTASVLHYATECFEGMKAYRGHDGRLRLFRPDKNCQRMLTSATRVALPAFDPRELEKLIKKLVATDGPKWLPKSRPGSFLYLRPTMIATGKALGVQKPKEATLFVLMACFPSFDEPTGSIGPDEKTTTTTTTTPEAKLVTKPGMKLLASKDDMIRAWPGGFGYAKLGANYGPSLLAQGEARERGYDQILWLFGPHGEVTEAGASNFFLIWRTRDGRLQLVTAPLGDKIILDGVTRRSVLELTRQRLAQPYEHDGDTTTTLDALEVVERKFTMSEIEEAIAEGRLVESFAAGTAFFIAAISVIHYRGRDLDVPMAAGTSGQYARVIKGWLKDIMYGNVQHEWGIVVDEEK
ncbi:MAG: hypothetical protein M1819_007045 [Sarea resinae]|nr:MAG: hypothetical protein M1819_007045 [Sarea resinae]